MQKKNLNINKYKIPEVTAVKMGFVDSYIIKGDADLTGENSWVIVDCGVAGSERKILKTMDILGIKPGKISLIVLTHAHMDHTGNVKELQKITGAKVAIQKEDAEFIIKGINAKVTPVTGFAGFMLKFMKYVPQKDKNGTTPDLIIENELDLNLFGVSGRVISTPGHTKGSISVLLDSGNCIVGDMIGKTFGKVKPGLFCNDIEENIKSIKKLINLNAKNLYLSHGGQCGIQEVKKYLNHN
jgi:hydroxyacylglutathione hydrolase